MINYSKQKFRQVRQRCPENPSKNSTKYEELHPPQKKTSLLFSVSSAKHFLIPGCKHIKLILDDLILTLRSDRSVVCEKEIEKKNKQVF